MCKFYQVKISYPFTCHLNQNGLVHLKKYILKVLTECITHLRQQELETKIFFIDFFLGRSVKRLSLFFRKSLVILSQIQFL